MTENKTNSTEEPFYVFPKEVEDQLRKGFHIEIFINKEGRIVPLKIQKEKLA